MISSSRFWSGLAKSLVIYLYSLFNNSSFNSQATDMADAVLKNLFSICPSLSSLATTEEGLRIIQALWNAFFKACKLSFIADRLGLFTDLQVLSKPICFFSSSEGDLYCSVAMIELARSSTGKTSINVQYGFGKDENEAIIEALKMASEAKKSLEN